jgi:hypothetical protein
MKKPDSQKENPRELFYRYFKAEEFERLATHFFSVSEFSEEDFWEDEESVDAFFRLLILGGPLAIESIDINQGPDLLTVRLGGKSIGVLTELEYVHLNEFGGPTFKSVVENYELEKLSGFFQGLHLDWTHFFLDVKSFLGKHFEKSHTLNIYSKEGDQVIYLDQNGWESDREQANKFLKKGQTYTIEKITVYKSSSRVYLKEIPGKGFNTVMFRNVRIMD